MPSDTRQKLCTYFTIIKEPSRLAPGNCAASEEFVDKYAFPLFSPFLYVFFIFSQAATRVRKYTMGSNLGIQVTALGVRLFAILENVVWVA